MLHPHRVLTVLGGDEPCLKASSPVSSPAWHRFSGVQKSGVFGSVLHPHENTWIDVTSTRGITRVECNVVTVVYNILPLVVVASLNLQSTKPGHSNGLFR